MRRLFLKIFLWFWVVQVLIGAVMFTLTTAMRFQPNLAREHPDTAFALGIVARDAAAAYERGGTSALRENLETVKKQGHLQAFLFDIRGRELSGAPVPPPVRDAAQRFIGRGAQNAASKVFAWRDGPVSTRVVQSAQGHTFRLAALLERPAPRGFSPGFMGDLIRPSGSSAIRLLVLLLTSGLLCYGLALYLTSPTVKLRRATRQLASGDLTTRVAKSMGRRRDELADLGRDFDQMAERIQALMLTERRLLADISHELRSPLTRLTVALDLIEDIQAQSPQVQSPQAPVSSTRLPDDAQKEREETRNYLSRIRRESERLNTLIGQLLTLSRLESGSTRREETPIALATLLEEIVQDANFEAKNRQREVRITRCDELETRGAPELLHSAIENVVRNAVHYTPENSQVEVSLQKDGSQALIRVLDKGAGVPQDALENLFRPFYRVADARDRQSGGTGLGLAITERAMRLHGGKVRASNAPDGGLLVELRFPLADAGHEKR